MSTLFFNGAIAQAGSVASALTQAQITEIFNLGREGNWLTTGHDWEFYYNGSNYATGTDGIEDSSTSTARDATITNGGISGSQNGTVQGSPDSITIREGLNSNRDGLGFYFTNPSSNVLRLNGIDEYVVTPDTDLSLSEQITIECWAKNNSDNLATDEYLVSQYETALGANRSWLFRMLSDEKLRVVWSSNGTNYSFTSTSSAITNVDTWRHYVTTIASGVAKIYVDGEIETIDSEGKVLTNLMGVFDGVQEQEILLKPLFDKVAYKGEKQDYPVPNYFPYKNSYEKVFITDNKKTRLQRTPVYK